MQRNKVHYKIKHIQNCISYYRKVLSLNTQDDDLNKFCKESIEDLSFQLELLKLLNSNNIAI